MASHYEQKVITQSDSSFYSQPGPALVSTNMSKGALGEQYNFKNHIHLPNNRYEYNLITPITFVE